MAGRYGSYEEFKSVVGADNPQATDTQIFEAWNEYNDYQNSRDSAVDFSVDQAQKLVGQGVQTVGGIVEDATGWSGAREWGDNIVAQQEEDIQKGGYRPEYPGTLRENYDQGGISGLAGAVWEKTQENLATSIAAPATALASIPVALVSAPAALAVGGGATLAMGAMNIGEAAGEMQEKGVEVDKYKAVGVGFLNTVLDRFGAKGLIEPSDLAKMSLGQVTKKLEQSGFEQAAKEIAARVSKEIATENLQESNIMLGAASQGAEYTGDELVDRYIDTSAVTAIPAGGFASVGTYRDIHQQNQLLEQRKTELNNQAEAEAQLAAEQVRQNGGSAVEEEIAKTEAYAQYDAVLSDITKQGEQVKLDIDLAAEEAKKANQERFKQAQQKFKEQKQQQPAVQPELIQAPQQQDKPNVLEPKIKKLVEQINNAGGDGQAEMQVAIDSGMNNLQTAEYLRDRVNKVQEQSLANMSGERELLPNNKQDNPGQERFNKAQAGNQRAHEEMQRSYLEQDTFSEKEYEAPLTNEEMQAFEGQILENEKQVSKPNQENETVDTASLQPEMEQVTPKKAEQNQENIDVNDIDAADIIQTNDNEVFNATHELANGTPVVATDEQNVWKDEEGSEWEESNVSEIQTDPTDTRPTGRDDSELPQQESVEVQNGGDNSLPGEAALTGNAERFKDKLRKSAAASTATVGGRSLTPLIQDITEKAIELGSRLSLNDRADLAIKHNVDENVVAQLEAGQAGWDRVLYSAEQGDKDAIALKESYRESTSTPADNASAVYVAANESSNPTDQLPENKDGSKATKNSKPSRKLEAAKAFINAEKGDVITFDQDIGYASANREYAIESISKDGSINLRNIKTGGGTSLSPSEIKGAKRRGVAVTKASNQKGSKPLSGLNAPNTAIDKAKEFTGEAAKEIIESALDDDVNYLELRRQSKELGIDAKGLDKKQLAAAVDDRRRNGKPHKEIMIRINDDIEVDAESVRTIKTSNITGLQKVIEAC